MSALKHGFFRAGFIGSRLVDRLFSESVKCDFGTFLLGVLVTEAKSVKISREMYERLCEVAGELQVKLKRPVSLDEAMEYLLKERKLKVSDFAGAWSMSDEEEAEILKSLREGWSRWKFPKE